MTQRRKVIFIAIFLGVGFLASVAYHFFAAYVLKLNYYPYNTFLFRPKDRFGDFLDNFNAGHDAYTKILVTRAMFPPFVLLCRMMYLINLKIVHSINLSAMRSINSKFMYLINSKIVQLISLKPLLQTLYSAGFSKSLLLIFYLAGFLFCLSVYILHTLQKCSIRLRFFAWVSMVLSFPVLISMDRANFENGIFLLVALSVGLLIKQKYSLAAVILGIASALKPYSAIYFLLFLIDEQFLAIIFGLAAWGILTIGSLLLLPTPLALEIHTLQASMGIYNQQYVVGHEGMYFGNSLFGLIKSMVYLIGDRFHLFSTSGAILQFIQALMGPYTLSTLAIAFVVTVILFLYRMPWWQKTAVIACCMNLLPYIGGAYRLLYFFIPLLMFLVYEERNKLDMVYLILFGLLFIPKGYIHFSFSPIYLMNPGELDDEAILHPILMLVTMILILWQTVRFADYSDRFSSLAVKLKGTPLFKTE
jgi:hypothetical protein